MTKQVTLSLPFLAVSLALVVALIALAIVGTMALTDDSGTIAPGTWIPHQTDDGQRPVSAVGDSTPKLPSTPAPTTTPTPPPSVAPTEPPPLPTPVHEVVAPTPPPPPTPTPIPEDRPLLTKEQAESAVWAKYNKCPVVRDSFFVLTRNLIAGEYMGNHRWRVVSIQTWKGHRLVEIIFDELTGSMIVVHLCED